MIKTKKKNFQRGLVLAAGLGSRLRPHTEDLPKCLLPVGNRTILQHTINCFEAAGLTDNQIVTGYKAEKIESLNIPTIYNPNYRNDNILGSFYEASTHWKNGAIICYSDILFDHQILIDLVEASGDIIVVVDPNWEQNYIGRQNHPVSEAELVQLNEMDDVKQMGKGISSNSTAGEFLGIFKISEKVGPQIYDHLNHLIKDNHRSQDWRNSYVTRYLTLLAQEGWQIKILECKHLWHEIDTNEDYLRVPKFFVNRNF